MGKRTRSVLTATAAAGAIVALTAAPAQADVGARAASAAPAGNCAGSIVGHYPLDHHGTRIGELVIYWDGSRNCARMNHLGPTHGVPLFTVVDMVACQETTPGPRCTERGDPDTDAGIFSFYAGPVYADARDRCINAFGYIRYAGANRYVGTSPVAAHCG